MSGKSNSMIFRLWYVTKLTTGSHKACLGLTLTVFTRRQPHSKSTGEMHLALKIPHNQCGRHQELYSPNTESYSNSPFKTRALQNAPRMLTMPPGSVIAPGVPELFPEEKGGISSTAPCRACHSFIWVRLSPPTILQEGGSEKLLMLRQVAKAWENTIKRQPAANANTIISPRQSTLCGKNNSQQKAVKFLTISEKDDV